MLADRHAPVPHSRSVTTPPTPIVVVLGMHRSGTSLCSNILSLLGVDMADVVSRQNGNDRGHWERWEIVEFHDRILQLVDRSYFSPSHDLPLPSGWWAEPEVRDIKYEIQDFLQRRMRPGELFGFKDPRTARLMPIWNQIFSNLNLQPKFVLCVRSPAQVARSLNARDRTPTSVGEYRWLLYNVECLRHVRKDLCVIDYEDWFTQRDETLRKLVEHVNLTPAMPSQLVDDAIFDAVDDSLRHTSENLPPARRSVIRYFYEQVRKSQHDAESRRRVDVFVEQFSAFQAIVPFDQMMPRAGDAPTEQAAESQAAEVRALRAELATLGIDGDDAGARDAQLRELTAVRAQEVLELDRLRRELEASGLVTQELASVRGELERQALEVNRLGQEREAHAVLERTLLEQIGAQRDEALALRAEIAASEARESALRNQASDGQSEADHLRLRLEEVEAEKALLADRMATQAGEIASLGEELTRARQKRTWLGLGR